MIKQQDSKFRKNVVDEDQKHFIKAKKSFEDRKLHRNIDNALKKKNWKQLSEMEYDEFR